MCTGFADVFDWENGPEDISQISIIAFLGWISQFFDSQNKFFMILGTSYALKWK